MEYPVEKETLIIPKVVNDDYLVGTEEQRFRSVKASLAMEGLIVTDEMEKIILAQARGEITYAEFIEKVKMMVSKSENEK